jgi:tetratricopeptide (TPR) repeat protein
MPSPTSRRNSAPNSARPSPARRTTHEPEVGPTRRKFAHEWDEIRYLYHKLLHWLYGREDRRSAQKFADRLDNLLRRASPDHEAIFGEECWSLVAEARDDLERAIAFRENEIRLIHKLWRSAADSPVRDVVLKNYGPDDLSDRMDLLAILYRNAGRLDDAIKTLRQSKRLCDEHGVPFDSEEMLQEFQEEKAEVGK